MAELLHEVPLATAGAAAARDVVFTFSYVTWRVARARGMYMPEDRLAGALLTHPRVRRLVVANQQRSLPIVLARSVGGAEQAGFPSDDRRRLVQPLRLRRSMPTTRRAVEAAIASYEAALRRSARRLGLQRPAIITAHPLVAGFGRFAWAGPVTYYATDDWAVHPAERPWWAVYHEAYDRLRDRGVRVCAVSRQVLEAVRPAGPSAVVPNGLEPAEWLEPGPPPAWLGEGGGPLLVYAGTLDSRLDLGAVAAVAEELPAARIVLVGGQVEPGHLAPLRGLPNVELRPPVPRAEVAGLIRAADAGLIPHAVTPLTRAMSPLKLYEYLAAGRPVAATDLPPMAGVSPHAELVPPGGDFPAAVRRALARGPAAEDERIAFVEANAWARRQEEILALALA